MATPGDKRFTNTRERLFEIALDLFSEKGVDGTSIRDIVGKAGISAAAFYNHYKSKDDLLQEIYGFYMARIGENEGAGTADLDAMLATAGPAGVVGWLAERFRASLEDPLLKKLAKVILMEQHRNPVAAEIARADRGKLVSSMEDLFAAMQEKGHLGGRNARLIGRMLGYLLLGFFEDNHYYRFVKDESAEAIINRQNAAMREFIDELIGGR